MAIIDVVKWDADPSVPLLAWKFDKQDLSTWTQLIVNESQEAVLYRGGAMDGPYGPGRHTLKTENIPVISKALNLPFGRSPFTAEVWYVNRAIALDVRWSTEDPIQLLDPMHKILVPVEAHGQYGVQVAHTRKFLVKLVGTMPDFSQEKLRDYLRGMILSIGKSTIAKEIIQKKVSILEISTELVNLSNAIRTDLEVHLEEFGLKLVNFFVSSINVREDDPSIVRLRDAMSKRAEMEIIGFSYQQERSLDVLEAAAGNQGTGGAAMGAGIGLGAGLAVGGAIGQGFQGIASNLNPQATQAREMPATTPNQTLFPCPSCNAPRKSPSSKFCDSCGTPFPQTAACAACGSPLAPAARFCANCGASAAPATLKCVACSAQLNAGAKFCATCGASQVSKEG